MNYALLEYEMKLKGKSKKDIQRKLGLSDSAIYRKMNGASQFTRDEIQIIIKTLKLKDKEVMDIFFRN